MVERKHRHIIDLGLTLLHHASLPLQFWDYAFTTSVYLINRLPTASLKFVTPFVTLFKKEPDYHFLFLWSTRVFPFAPTYSSIGMRKSDLRSSFLSSDSFLL